jgi:hypothetical protein
MKMRCLYATVLSLLVLVCVAPSADAPKRTRFDGIWRWEFTMPDGGQVTPSLKLRTKEGQLTGTSRFRSGTETPITNIVVDGATISFDVVRNYLGDPVVTHYTGRVQGDILKGKIVSESNGEKHTYDWKAERASGIDGVWKWPVTFRDQTFEQRVTLKLEGDKVRGKLATGRGESDIHRGRFRDNRVTFEVERRGRDGGEKTTNYYRGKFDGDTIVGTYTSTFGGLRTNEWNATRAD